jgi:trimeric autotransporter adhesin
MIRVVKDISYGTLIAGESRKKRRLARDGRRIMKVLLLIVLLLVTGVSKSQIIYTIAGKNTTGYSGDGFAATAAELNHPIKMALDGYGNLFITDEYNHVVRKINISGIITTIAGNGFGSGTTTGGYSGDGGPATLAELNVPIGISISRTGDIYIAEQSNHIIRKINPLGIITTVAGNGFPGYSGDGGQATAAQLTLPSGVAVDSVGNLFVAEYGNHIIRKIFASGIISTVAGTGIAGYTGDNIAATNSRLHSPFGVALDNSGNIFIADEDNNRVRKINTLGIITTVAGNGMIGTSGDGGLATAAKVQHPVDISIDRFGNFYLAEQGQNVVREVDTSGIISSVAGNGNSGYSGDGGPATAAMIKDALGIVVNGFGNLFIADYLNNVIRKVTFRPEEVNNVNYSQTPICIFPNPAYKNITLMTRDNIEFVELLNIVGQVVFRNYVNKNNIQINIEQLPNSIFFVKVNGVYVGKFVKE